MNASMVKGYSLGFRILHWAMAFFIISMLIFGFFLEDLPKAYQDTAYMLHKSFGLTLLFLMMLRFLWIKRLGKPALPDRIPFLEKLLAHTVQYFMYIFIILMALAGWIMSVAKGYIPNYFGLFPVYFPGVEGNKPLGSFMGEAHEVIAWILIALITLHILGALKHHFINKNNVLKRMITSK